jgi:hypothetical protein
VRHGWSSRYGGPSDDRGQAVAVDQSGNIYVTGYFIDSVDLGGGVLTSAGVHDIFLASFTRAGKHRWSKRFGAGTIHDRGEALVVDGQGNVVVTGEFKGKASFGGQTLTGAGERDVFLASFTPAGDHRWSKRLGGAGYDYAQALGVDGSGNLALAGLFEGTVDLGGGELKSAGGYDIFLASFTPEGKHRWSHGFGASEDDYATAVAVDASGNVYLGGTFQMSAGFGGAELSSAGASDALLAKYSPSGAHLWSKRFGGQLDDAGPEVVVGDPGVLLAGHFEGTVDLGGGDLTSAGGWDIFLSRYSAAGKHQVSRRFGGASADQVSGVALDPRGGVIVTGTFSGTSSLGGGDLAAAGEEDLYIARYDVDGRHLWSRALGGPKPDASHAVAADADGRVVVTGCFEGEADLGGGVLKSAGGFDIFVLTVER